MARRFRIPLLLDVVIVDDPQEMAELNRNLAVSRVISGHGGLLHWAIHRRIYGALRVGAEPLPVFAGREDTVRAARQGALEARLSTYDLLGGSVAGEIEQLGRYVAGEVVERPVGVTVQQLVGRLFRSGYVATPASYKAALIMSEWPRANPAKALWWRWSGRLSRSKAMLWEIGADDPACIHATTIAFHNVVAAVERLRAAAGASDAGTRPVYQVLRESLVAPATLLRSVTDDVRVPSLQRPLRKGTLLIFKLGTIYDRTRDPALAFARSEWNQCPGHDVVPRALEAVWTRAMALQRGRP